MKTETQLRDRVLMMDSSLRCFALGCAGLIPVLGFPAALLALSRFRQARSLQKAGWNPARSYLLSGAVLGVAGFLISVLCIGIAAMAFLNSIEGLN